MLISDSLGGVIQKTKVYFVKGSLYSESIKQMNQIILRYTARNKLEKLEGKGEASFDTPFMIQSYAKSMKEIMGVL